MVRAKTLYASFAFLAIATVATVVGCNSGVEAQSDAKGETLKERTALEPYTLYWGGGNLRRDHEIRFTVIEAFPDGRWVRAYTPEKPGHLIWLNISRLTWIAERPTESAVANIELYEKLEEAHSAIENDNRDKALGVFEGTNDYVTRSDNGEILQRRWEIFTFTIKYAYNIGFKKQVNSERYGLFDPSKAVQRDTYFEKTESGWTINF